MSLKSLVLAGAVALLPTLALAQMQVDDPYARAGSPMAQSGAAFMAITNATGTDDRLVGATSDIAERAELHTHVQTAEGVMQMREVEGGIPLPAGETVTLERGGLHVMFLGLTRPMLQGETFELTLEFETAPPLTITVPVDLERMPGQPGMGMHHGHGHGAMHGTGG
ncbi:copper chaperone PCu(A)C [Roseicyclus persicicus]|uniref:Copper chaperone PCu(A)C n=1 Tax=Roseicyclus persicicus TaxID=2650661 RepID=A0A7X6GW05_9RHOB|nr:copper chaperone PCu(A)C [Roseibacterium persicicum]NKX43415.1 copper chaperone PCu(A)C [Roseibacterium persicicum]